MKDNQDLISKKKFLFLAYVWTFSWILIGYLLFSEYREMGGDGVIGLITAVKEGNYSIMILFGLSVLFLAQAIRNFYLYFSTKEDVI